jgi:hypothetical protein
MGGVTVPKGNNFWNPYRWVPVSKEPVARETPAYRHRWEGLSGRLECTLEALTPLLIGSSKSDGRFIRSKLTNQPFVPATSLKGLIRALAELIGNAAIPFPGGHADQKHTLSQASKDEGIKWQLDIAARMFGYLNQGTVFAGLVRFSDGRLVGREPTALTFKVAGGSPDVEHRPFYLDQAARKFYHHQPDAEKLTGPHAGIKEGQKRSVYPLPAGVKFTFKVDFENLREEELALLLYCLVLEENASATLGVAALGPGHDKPFTLTGPLRHKFGGCKPQGAGSVKITIDKMMLPPAIADRYRGGNGLPQELQNGELAAELTRRTQPIALRTDATMTHLRAMLIYSTNDPRWPVAYPDYPWFQQDKNTAGGTPLKATL